MILLLPQPQYYFKWFGEVVSPSNIEQMARRTQRQRPHTTSMCQKKLLLICVVLYFHYIDYLLSDVYITACLMAPTMGFNLIHVLHLKMLEPLVTDPPRLSFTSFRIFTFLPTPNFKSAQLGDQL